VLYNRAGLVDIPAQTKDVADDITIAESWQRGQIDQTAIERSPTEAGFGK